MPFFRRLPGSGLELAWNRLAAARRDMEYCLEVSSQKTPALYLYQGGFYTVFDVELVKKFVDLGRLRLFIISGDHSHTGGFGPRVFPLPGLQPELRRHN